VPADASADRYIPDGGCIGRQCQVDYYNCPVASGPTTVTGVVYSPAGTLPVYNAKVYIPSGDVPPIAASGASCDRCESIVPPDAVVSTTTDIDGKFTLTWAPSGQDVPVVIALGKWRRVVTIPTVTPCVQNMLDPTQTRLPRNQGEGNIPKIALSTGGEDAMECLLRSGKLGLDDSEFTGPQDSGRVNLFAGGLSANSTAGSNGYATSLNGGAAFPSSNGWWDQLSNLNTYDLVMLSCEGNQNPSTKSVGAHAALQSYLNAGGRVLASHWHNIWISGGPMPLNTVAGFVASGGYANDATAVTATVGTTLPMSAALAKWLLLPSVNGSTQLGQLMVSGARVTLASRAPGISSSWVDFSDPSLPMGLANPASQYFWFTAPINAPAAMQCGQMAFTDLHASGGQTDLSSPNKPFPTGCTSTSMTPQEKALIFMLLQLTSCL
jgi:hypothetical protein